MRILLSGVGCFTDETFCKQAEETERHGRRAKASWPGTKSLSLCVCTCACVRSPPPIYPESVLERSEMTGKSRPSGWTENEDCEAQIPTSVDWQFQLEVSAMTLRSRPRVK